LDDVFKALADPTRRAILDRLHREGGQTLGELCSGLEMTRQGVSKHLAILERAGLVVAEWVGREKHHYLNAMPIQEISARWIHKFEQPRVAALQELKDRLEGSKR
jgi:DNA-binding transcriptional ArsR family regulator